MPVGMLTLTANRKSRGTRAVALSRARGHSPKRIPADERAGTSRPALVERTSQKLSPSAAHRPPHPGLWARTRPAGTSLPGSLTGTLDGKRWKVLARIVQEVSVVVMGQERTWSFRRLPQAVQVVTPSPRPVSMRLIFYHALVTEGRTCLRRACVMMSSGTSNSAFLDSKI